MIPYAGNTGSRRYFESLTPQDVLRAAASPERAAAVLVQALDDIEKFRHSYDLDYEGVLDAIADFAAACHAAALKKQWREK